MSGAGNSFWITHFIPTAFLPLPPPSPINRDWAQVAQSLCWKDSTPETDGLAVLLPSKTCDFKWLFYNADGSPAEMCGNAACCVIEYAFKKQLVPSGYSSITFETTAQKIKGELCQGSARIFLKQNNNIQGPFEITFNKKKISYTVINSSVPHAVIETQNWPNTTQEWENTKALARNLRKKTIQHLDGMNVSFYCHQGKENQLYARSFERGVEDFTPACGTGALAVAQVYRQHCTDLELVFVQMPGGQLKVGFHPDKTISLISPVKWLQEMEEK